MSYEGTIAYLYSLQKYGIKFGLDNIRRLMAAFDNPQDSFYSIHVAGTNGKGSTSAMIESLLRTSGVTTGLFTSPHLVSFTERIRVNGREISEAEVVSLAGEVRRVAETIPGFLPTFFEVTAAMAFLYFRKMHVAWAVVEVGMGGRLDATNILTPEASVITAIDIDHGDFLGSTLGEIAGEKAGIIKQGVPVISALQRPEAAETLKHAADKCNAQLITYGKDFSAEITADELVGIRINYRGDREYRDLSLQIAGRHQALNAALAVRTMEEVVKTHPDMHCDIRQGLADTRWPGRLEFVKDHPPILIDGAHNPHAAAVLAEYLRKALGLYSRIILIMGIMNDKDRKGIMTPLLPLASEIIFTAAGYGRAASPETLAAEARGLGYLAHTALTVADALNLAERLALQGDLIVVTGSFYTIGEVKEALGPKGVLARLRE
ncbi:MAG: bifunctional folylpolyglutamate synthase/dihydrofolate synthase [Nitrospirae bacterium]|nr:bifunctional folylpolyglutamate synthase/dihydrofolate synthase [Nitrospirota bacterium]